MMPVWHRWIWITASAVLAVAAFAFTFDAAWSWLGVYSLQVRFGDLVAILAAGEAHAAGLDVYQSPNPFDPFGRPHVYGPGWLLTGSLGLKVADAVWLGSLLVAAFVVATASVLGPRSRREAFISVLLLLSPPVLLGINRGNNDLIVFLLLAGAAWLLARPGLTDSVGAVAVLVTAASLKLYPIAALPMVLMRPGRRRSVVALGAAFLVLSVAVAAVYWDDYVAVARQVPSPNSVFAYGIQIPWCALRASQFDLVGGWAAGVLIAALALRASLGGLWRGVEPSGFTSLCYMAGAVTWSFCFLTANSYGYRMVLLLLVARQWLLQLQAADRAVAHAARIQLGLLLVLLWLALPKSWWADLASARQGLPQTAATLRDMIAGVEEGLATGLTAALLVGIAGACWRWLVRRDSVT